MTKRFITTEIDTIFEFGTVADLIKELNMIATNAVGELTYRLECYDDYGNPACSFTIYEERLETDEQYAKRKASEKLHVEAQAKREKAEFERLKAKFGE